VLYSYAIFILSLYVHMILYICWNNACYLRVHRRAACGTEVNLKSDLLNAVGDIVLQAGCTVHIVLLMVTVQGATGREVPKVAWPWAMTAVVAAQVATEDGSVGAWEPIIDCPVPIEMLNCTATSLNPRVHFSFYQMAAQTAQVQAIQQFIKTKAAFNPLVYIQHAM